MVEDDEFVYEAWITNDGDVPFPSHDMDVIVAWKFPDGHGHDKTFHLKKDQLKPGDPPIQVWANIKVQAPGYAQFFITYPKANGCALHDSEKREIDGTGRYSLASFRAASFTERWTLWALYLAIVSALLAALGLLLR